jgi:uncharacterized protein (DUF1330 family)
MRIYVTVAISIAAGMVIGGFAMQGLRAQGSPPVYFISDIAEITDPEAFKAVGQRPQSEAADRVNKAGGQYVTRTQKLTAIYGTPPQRLIIIKFDNMQKAQAFVRRKSGSTASLTSRPRFGVSLPRDSKDSSEAAQVAASPMSRSITTNCLSIDGTATSIRHRPPHVPT